MELSVHYCLESLGIFHLGDWDVWAFVYRHGVSLISLEQIARLTGYQTTVVAEAMARLERGKFIERSRPSREIHLYRTMALTDLERRRCLEYLIGVSENRSGRLQLTKELKSVTPDLARPKQVAGGQDMEGSDHA